MPEGSLGRWCRELCPCICHQGQAGEGYTLPAQQCDEMACMKPVLSVRTNGLLLAMGSAFTRFARQSAHPAANYVSCHDLALSGDYIAIAYFSGLS